MVESSVQGTSQEERYKMTEFEGEERSPLKEVIAKKSRANSPPPNYRKSLMKMITPWAKEPGKGEASSASKRGKKAPTSLKSSGDEKNKPITGGLASWRRNYGLLPVLQQTIQAMETEKLSFTNLKFNLMVYQPLIANGTITIDTKDSKKVTDNANDLKNRVKTILEKFKITFNLPPRVCPESDHEQVEAALVSLLELDREYEGNVRCKVRQFAESTKGKYFDVSIWSDNYLTNFLKIF